MKYAQTLILAALSAVVMCACDSGNDRFNVQRCSATEPCDSSSQVCVNHYCVDKCGADNPCPANLRCSTDGICLDPNDIRNETGCSDSNPCVGDKICVSGQCIECSEQKPCAAGKKCDAGLCVIDPDYHAGSCTQSADCAPDYVCQDSKCVARCTSSEQCTGSNRVCDAGMCIDACYAGICGEGLVCERGTRICVPGECSWYDDCAKGYVCDEANHVCLERCTAGSCASGTVCDEDGFCVAGECSRIDNVCPDPTKACDRDAMKCVPKCASSADCESGKLCDTTGLCVVPCTAGSCDEGYACMPTGLCVEAECSVIDACDISYKTCVDNKCVDKCKRDSDCDGDKICNAKTGVCVLRCTASSCEDGQVCGDSGFCVKGNCSSLTPCPGNLLCSADNQCVEPGKLYNDCYYYRECDDCEKEYNLCLTDCDSASSQLATALAKCQETRNNCTNDYATCESDKTKCDASAQEEFDELSAHCESDKTCNALRTALNAKISECTAKLDKCTRPQNICQTAYDNCISTSQQAFDDADCSHSRCIADFNTCEKNRVSCESKNKLCPEGKQCNAYNQCVDSATAGGLGLGIRCNDGHGNVQKCGDGLSCIIRSSDNLGFCKPSAFEHDRQSCSPGAFQDRCEGNIILECDDETGLVFVQDCKTSYVDYSTPTTGKFYGDDFYCLQRPNSKYVSCAQACDSVGTEKFICGWDIDDTDIDYSDRYVCQINSEGHAAYFPVDSETCSATCDYFSGKCD